MNTPESKSCPQCGLALAADTPGGLCPRCVMAMNLAPETILTQPDDPAPGLQPLSPEKIADKFPGYEILECLGRGGMGVVYKARQKSLDRIVAIKILPPERVGEERFADRFAIEAATLAKLNHPNIVTVHDFGETGGLFYIVMEYVDGVNLRDLLREGKLEPQQALAIVPPVCDALQSAHEKGIVHRDIKPENILLDKDGRVKIADFGIAKLIGPVAAVCDRRTSPAENPQLAATAATVMAGTQGYAAPEQANGTADHRADIYALGVVLYEMLTGERPNKDVVAPSRKVRIDVRLDEMVLRALEKEPERRYQTAGEFRTMVETIGSTPVIAKPPAIPASSPPRGMIRRWWWLFLVMIPLGLALGLAAGVVLTYIVPKKYEARALIQVWRTDATRTTRRFFDTEFEKLSSYEILTRISKRLELENRWMIPQEQVVTLLKSFISVENIHGTDLIDIRVCHRDANEAAEIANTLAGVYRESSPDGVIIHETANAPQKPVSPNVLFYLTIGALAGVMVSPFFALLLMGILQRLVPERRNQPAIESGTVAETAGNAPVSGASPAYLLKSTECLYATPEFHQTIWGAMKIHQGLGSLFLYQDRLEVQAGLSRTTFPLETVRRLDLIRYPFFQSPAGLRSIEIEFEDGNRLQRLVLTPSKGMFSFVGTTNKRVLEWFGSIREAIVASTGNAPPGSDVPLLYQGFSGEGTLVASCVMLGSFAVLLAVPTFLAMTASWRSILPMAIPLVFGASFVLALAWGQRRQRRKEPGSEAAGRPASVLVWSIALHGMVLLALALAAFMLLPSYGEIFSEFATPLPAATQWVFSIGRFVRGGGWLLFPVVFAVDVLICLLLFKRPSRKAFTFWVIAATTAGIGFAALCSAAIQIPMRALVHTTMDSKALDATPQDNTTHFGPVAERVLDASTNQTGCCGLDFDDSRLWKAAAIQPDTHDQRDAWIIRHGIDLMAVSNGGSKWTLATLRAGMAPVPETAWMTATPADLRGKLRNHPLEVADGLGYCPIRFVGGQPLTFVVETDQGVTGLLQVVGINGDPKGLRIRYKLEQGRSGRFPQGATDRVLLEDLALHLIVAIREKDNAKLKSLASDRIKGWPEALPVFAVELREHMRQATGNDKFDLRAGESLVDGDFAAVRCTGPAELDEKCLVLFFVKSADGWRSFSLCNATTATPLARILADLNRKSATNKQPLNLSKP